MRCDCIVAFIGSYLIILSTTTRCVKIIIEYKFVGSPLASLWLVLLVEGFVLLNRRLNGCR